MATSRTYQPKKLQRSKEHGFQENVHCQRPQGYRPPSCTRPRPSDPLKREQLAYRMLHMKQ